MSGLLQHLKVSAVADGPDASQVQPSDWNAAHVFSGGNHGAIPLRDTTDATYGSSWLASVAAGQALISNGVGAAPSWSASPSLTGLTLSGLLTVNGFGNHAFSSAGTGEQAIAISNGTNGAGNLASLRLDAATNGLRLHALAPGYASSAPYIAAGGALLALGAGGWSIGATDAAGAIRFYTGGVTLRAELSPVGNWGLNDTPDPTTRLRVNAGAGQGALAAIAVTGGNIAVYGRHDANSATGYVAYFLNNGAGNGLYLGNTGAWTAISDRRLKTDIRALDALDGLRRLAPRDFLWAAHADAEDPPRRQYGFIAQEVLESFPNLITASPTGHLGVNYDGVIAPLVQGWQDHEGRLAHLEALVGKGSDGLALPGAGVRGRRPESTTV